MNTTATIQQWGNSQGIRLPKDLLATVGASVGDTLRIASRGKSLTITPHKTSIEDMTLAQVLSTMPHDYNPSEWDTGAVVGSEVW